MNAEKLTQKSREAIIPAHSTAISHSHQQVDQIHLLYALLTQENGLISSLLQKMGLSVQAIKTETEKAVSSLPAVHTGSRPTDNIYITADLDRAVTSAEETAARMKDSYVSLLSVRSL